MHVLGRHSSSPGLLVADHHHPQPVPASGREHPCPRRMARWSTVKARAQRPFILHATSTAAPSATSAAGSTPLRPPETQPNMIGKLGNHTTINDSGNNNGNGHSPQSSYSNTSSMSHNSNHVSSQPSPPASSAQLDNEKSNQSRPSTSSAHPAVAGTGHTSPPASTGSPQPADPSASDPGSAGGISLAQLQELHPEFDRGVFSVQLKVRDYELDQFNVVNNAIFASHLQHARHEAFAACGFHVDDQFAQKGRPMALSEMQISFKAPLRSRDIFSVTTTIAKLTAARAYLYQEVVLTHRAGKATTPQVVASGTAVVVFLDSSYRPLRIPSSVRAVYQQLSDLWIGHGSPSLTDILRMQQHRAAPTAQ